MRLVTIAVLALGLTVAACNTASTAANAPAATATGDPAAVVPAGTTGATDTPRQEAVHQAAWREVTIPAGTQLPIVLDTSVGSDTSHVEQAVTAHLARAVSVRGQTVLPEGSRVGGVVTDAKRSAKVKGRAHLALRFDTLTPRGDDQRYTIQTTAVGRTAPGTKKKDALEIGLPAAGGAAIGALIGGKKGALIGTAAGGGAGTAVVLSTRGKEVHLGQGASLTLRLTAPVTIRVRG